MDTKAEYRTLVQNMGKKEFTFLKMQEYGFWPSNLPTPYERQQNETEEDFENRKKLLAELQKLSEQISEAYQEKTEIEKKISHLKKQYEDTWDYEKIRAVVSQEIMKESIARRAERKAERERQKQLKSEAWNKRKAENIVFIGKGCVIWCTIGMLSPLTIIIALIFPKKAAEPVISLRPNHSSKRHRGRY